MPRLIPRKVKTQLEIVKGLTLLDVFYLIGCGLVFGIFMLSDIPYNYVVGAIVALLMASMVISVGGVRMYILAGYAFRFFAHKKLYTKHFKNKRNVGYNVRDIVPYRKIEDELIHFGGYYASVVQIEPIEFFLLNEQKQEMVINSLSNALRRLTDGQTGSIYKIEKPMIFDSYVKTEQDRYDAMSDNYDMGMYSDKEMETRERVFGNRVGLLEYYNTEQAISKAYFYFVVYDKDRETLKTTIDGVMGSLSSTVTQVSTKVLKDEELAIFLRSTYDTGFDEREVKGMDANRMLNWATPNKIRFRSGSVEVNDKKYSHFTLADYPMQVGNAWAYQFFNFEKSKVCVNFKVMARAKAEKMIDNTILEMEGKLAKTFKASQKMEGENTVQNVRQLLADLKSQNENLFEINFHIVCETSQKKEIRSKIKERGFKQNDMFGRQVDAFISRSVSMRDNLKEKFRGMQTSTVAGMFPFISDALQDDDGFYVGYNRYPVLIDFFKRNHERVNSNMIVIGKSGSGKSFAAKLLLTNFAASDAKIFVLDPEREYVKLTNELGGKEIDVGSGLKYRFNPLHIMATLEDEDGENSDSYVMHLQFLEEFFKIILEGISPDALETLNRVVADLYSTKNINSKTDIMKLKPEDFPTFDELYELTQKKHDASTDEYLRVNYKVCLNYIAKFATGGRNAGLWNGPTNIETRENFIVFAFRSLLANRNQSVARAQMLLTFKYLDNEIIKNRDYNLKNKAKRKIIIAVDEAHVFINPKYPIALDFMFQMAKRIRKYSGMQIILTQNIRDFMGSEDMIRQSSAIIAASQYSMIFSLSPNDVTELVKLYKNAGEINESEQDSIVTAPRGFAFFISGPMSRTSFQVHALDDLIDIFEENK